MTYIVPASEIVGHEGIFKLPGGRATYEAVMIRDGGTAIRLARLEVRPEGLHQVDRYIDWEQPVEVIRDFTEEHDKAREVELARWEAEL